MLTFLASIVGPRFAKPLLIGLAILLALASLWAWGQARYRAGVKDERAAWELRLERAKAAQTARERAADQTLAGQRERDQAEAQQRKQEIDDATRDIPDQGLTARQRAILCVELRRQARASGEREPAC